jgi:hypothetical protein
VKEGIPKDQEFRAKGDFRTQAERRLMLSRAHVRVEAKLSKDVYSAGEAINVHVVMHSTGKRIPVRKIRAEAVQLISVCHPHRRQRATSPLS